VSGEIVLYQTEDGRTRVECRFAEDTLWLSQALMGELFQTTPQNITLHLKALYAEGEIEESATCKEYLQVRAEGGRDPVCGPGILLVRPQCRRQSKRAPSMRLTGPHLDHANVRHPDADGGCRA
jgi:hypothetical protein